MGNLSQLMAKQTLDWSLSAAAPTQVAGNFVGLASIAVTSTPGGTVGEWATNVYVAGNYAHISASMGAAATVAGSASASNNAALVFGAVSVNGLVASGIFLTDSISSGAGTFLYWGSLAAARTLSSGDTITFPIGALSITMA